MKVWILSIALICFKTFSFAQPAGSIPGKVNIASPNSASIGKYGDIPVSQHTGIPNISIPIHTVSSGSLSLPISLSYHAGGIKVEENDSWVGAGWTLIAGGVINRTVKDKPDERQASGLTQQFGYFTNYGYASYWDSTNVDGSNLDNEPDLFSINGPGISGKFYFNDDRTPILVPSDDLKIEYSYTPGIWNNSPGATSGLGRCIESFVITNSEGTKYYFGIPQIPTVSPYCDPIEVSTTMTSEGISSYGQVITSWYLYKIESKDGNSIIELKYKRDKYSYFTYSNPVLGASLSGNKYTLVKNLMAGVQLNEISDDNEKIVFNPGIVREDLSRWSTAGDESLSDNINQTSTALGSISIFNNQQILCFKKFDFTIGYFPENSSSIHPNFGTKISDKKRLKLISLQEKSCDNSIVSPSYTFEYFDETIPRKLSFSKDHWGYNNGISTNTELYPTLYNNNGSLNSTLGIATANRESAWPAMRAGTLKKITYPLGGSTTLNFEPNYFATNQLVNGVNTLVNKMIGGLRVITLTHFEPISNQSQIINYSYNDTNGISHGILFGKPVYIQILRNEWVKKFNYYNSNGCVDGVNSTNVVMRPFIYSDNPIRPMESTQGYHVGYKEVKVSQTGNGYTIYKFDVGNPSLIDRNGVAIDKINNPGMCGDDIPFYPAAPITHNFNRGELIYEGVYNQNGNLINDKNYVTIYQDENVTIPGRLVCRLPGNALNSVSTFYEIKTSKRISTSFIEKEYINGISYEVKNTFSSFNSPFHNKLSETHSINSKGEAHKILNKYALDYYSPSVLNISNCYSSSPTGNSRFLNSLEYYYSNGNYNSLTAACSSASDPFACRMNYSTSFFQSLFNARKTFINCRKLNYTNAANNFTTTLNNSLLNADSIYRPVIWMQKLNQNALIESIEYNAGKVISANYLTYSNYREDQHGIYQNILFKDSLWQPSTNFILSYVSSNGSSINKDPSYKINSYFYFDKGNLISIKDKGGNLSSYKYGYNQKYPIAELSGAGNFLRDVAQETTVDQSTTSLVGAYTSTSPKQMPFIQSNTGPITISLNTTPPYGAKTNLTYTISGPINQTGYLCLSNNGGSCSYPSTLTISNVPAGSYNLSVTASSTFTSYSYNAGVKVSYKGKAILPLGREDFYMENFEENTSSYVVIGNSNTGEKHYSGSFSIPFIKGSGKYVLQWWNKDQNVWKFNQEEYNNGKIVSGIIDDIRIFPYESQMNSYTYIPGIGISSKISTNGDLEAYSYDKLGRLEVIKDRNGNIVKRICYSLNGQPTTCDQVPVIYYNDLKTQSFTRNNCPSGYSGSSVTYTVAANTYSSTIDKDAANQLAQNEINAQGQTYANTNGTCTASCPFTTVYGYNNLSSGFTSSEGQVSFYVSFSFINANTVSWSSYNQIGTITGVCRPSTTRTINLSSGGRVWSIQIGTAGQFSIKLLSGSAPTGTTPISISGGIYSL
jgi:hypothetical protein